MPAWDIPEARERCEAMAQSPHWPRVFDDLPCTRDASGRVPALAEVALCHHHHALALRHRRLALTGCRTLLTDRRSEEDPEMVSARVVDNLRSLHRRRTTGRAR